MTTRLIIGWLNGSPIYALRGADGGEISLLIDDGDDGDDDGDDDDDAEVDGDGQGSAGGDGGQGDDWPPSRDEWNRLRNVARTATRQAVQRKRLLREHGVPLNSRRRSEADADASSGGSDSGEPTGRDDDRRAAIAEARDRSQREERLTTGLKRKALQAELREAGWVGDDFKLATRMIDFDAVEVEIGDDGEPIITGMSDQVAAIKAEIPAWFKRRRAAVDRQVERTGAEAVDGGHRAAPPAPKTSGWRRQISDQLGGVTRR